MSRTVTEALLDKIDQQDKEIERLEAEIERLRKHLDACSDTCGFQARQIERLRAALQDIVDCVTHDYSRRDIQATVLAALEDDDE